MASSSISKHAALAVLAVAPAFSQAPQKVNVHFDLPSSSPIEMTSADWTDTKATPRGGAFFVDVRASLSFRNHAQRHVRAVTLAVLSQDVTPGGKGSVSVPSLDIGPEQTFPVNIDLHLLRPLAAGGGTPNIEVRLDGVLFEDLTFYGPNLLHSQRTMTVWELQARRDRQYFKKQLETAGANGLRDAMVASVARQSDPPPGGVQVVRGRATTLDPEREVSFAFLHMPGEPVDAGAGMVKIAGNEARAPRVQVKNTSAKTINYLEISWIAKNQEGREFLAASMPADVALAPGRTQQVAEDASMLFDRHTTLHGMTGMVSSVGFADGTYWIPGRDALSDPQLRRLTQPSPEEQRLTQLYLKRGINGLIEELKKF